MTARLRFAAVLLGLLYILPTLGRAEEDDCTRGLPEAVIDAKAKGVAKHSYKDDLAKREAKETAVLKDGLELTVQHYGCAHYGLSFEFKVKGAKAKDAKALLKEAAALLDRLAKADPQNPSADFSKHIQKALEDPDYAPGDSISITAGYSSFSVEEETDSKGRRWIKVAYDIAL